MDLKDIWGKITGAQKREDEAYREAAVKGMDDKKRAKQAGKDYADARFEKQQQDQANAKEFRDTAQSPSERMGSEKVGEKVREKIKPERRDQPEKAQVKQAEPEAEGSPRPRVADSMLEPLSAKEQEQWRQAYGEAKVTLHPERDGGRKL